MKQYNIPIEATLEIIGGKWKVVILCHLTKGTKRTSELQRLIPEISVRMLTQQLRELEEDGVITRKFTKKFPSSRILPNRLWVVFTKCIKSINRMGRTMHR